MGNANAAPATGRPARSSNQQFVTRSKQQRQPPTAPQQPHHTVQPSLTVQPTGPQSQQPTVPTRQPPTVPTLQQPTVPTGQSPAGPTVQPPMVPTVQIPTVPTVQQPTVPTLQPPSGPTVQPPSGPTVQPLSGSTVQPPSGPTQPVTVQAVPTQTTPTTAPIPKFVAENRLVQPIQRTSPPMVDMAGLRAAGPSAAMASRTPVAAKSGSRRGWQRNNLTNLPAAAAAAGFEPHPLVVPTSSKVNRRIHAATAHPSTLQNQPSHPRLNIGFAERTRLAPGSRPDPPPFF